MDEQAAKTLQKKIVEEYDRVCLPVTDKIKREEKMIPALDGAKLRTIIFQPDNIDGPYATIVIRSCYPESEQHLEIQAKELAKRGFAVVYQWCRGLAGSEGEWTPYEHEREDGTSLMNYLQGEKWVKNIGFVGASYLALTGWFIADIIPEKVKTMYLTVLGTEWHTETWQEGAFRQDIFTSWIMGMANDGKAVNADYLTSAKYRPQIQVDEKLWNCHMKVYRDMISKPEPDDIYWTDGLWGTLREIPSKTKIPIFIGEGWYDIHLGNALQTFGKLSKCARQNSVLQVNPGNHSLNPVIFGQKKQNHAAICEYEQQIRWFYNILVKEEMPQPEVRYYLIGADEWRTYTTYPVNAEDEKCFYLNGNKLTEAKTALEESAYRSYIYDPENPVISHGAGTLFYSIADVGSLEQPGPDWREDVLSYVSDPLEEDIDIVGTIQAKLWVQSDAPDTCFTIKLIEEFEDGTAYNIRNGITTLGLRNESRKRVPYDGKPVEITIRCWDIAWRVKKGSKLRVDISSSNFPEYSIHPNTEKIWSLEENTKIANQKILSGKEWPSRLLLPIDVQMQNNKEVGICRK